ncbi:MAG: hypothetical protein ACRCVX_06610 [Shewanella sp.]
MTNMRDTDARAQFLGRIVRKWLIRIALPADNHFNDAWLLCQRVLRSYNDAHEVVTILRDLPDLDPDVLRKAESDYQTYGNAVGGLVMALLNTPCVRPDNMRRKLALAIEENADASDVASLIGDLEVLEGWIGG